MDDKINNKLEEIKKMLSEITSWPWDVITDQHDNVLKITNKKPTLTERGEVVFGYGYEFESRNANFISKSPEIISELIKVIESFYGAKDE